MIIQIYLMNILYQDKYCTVTDVCVVINKYYFPLATSKTIMFDEITKISLQDALNVRHLWGPSSHFLNNWFHLDPQRRSKDKFLSFRLEGQKIMPALTPDDATKVFQILRAHFYEIDRRSAFSKTQKDGQTSMDHREAQEQFQAMKEQRQVEMKEVKNEEAQEQQNNHAQTEQVIQ